MEAVLGGEELLVFVEHRVAGDGLVFFGTEDEADGGVVPGDLVEVFIEADVAVHLADVLVGELADLVIDEDEAFQEVVVEDEIDKELVAFEAEEFLAGNEAEAAPKFEEEGLEVIHDGLLEGGLAEARGAGDAEEFQDGGGGEDFRGILHGLPGALIFEEAFFVSAGEEAFVVKAVDLALQLAGGPAGGGAFGFVEIAGIGFFDAHEGAVLGP